MVVILGRIKRVLSASLDTYI